MFKHTVTFPVFLVSYSIRINLYYKINRSNEIAIVHCCTFLLTISSRLARRFKNTLTLDKKPDRPSIVRSHGRNASRQNGRSMNAKWHLHRRSFRSPRLFAVVENFECAASLERQSVVSSSIRNSNAFDYLLIDAYGCCSHGTGGS